MTWLLGICTAARAGLDIGRIEISVIASDRQIAVSADVRVPVRDGELEDVLPLVESEPELLRGEQSSAQCLLALAQLAAPHA
jgi:hypothetical protein